MSTLLMLPMQRSNGYSVVDHNRARLGSDRTRRPDPVTSSSSRRSRDDDGPRELDEAEFEATFLRGSGGGGDGDECDDDHFLLLSVPHSSADGRISDGGNGIGNRLLRLTGNSSHGTGCAADQRYGDDVTYDVWSTNSRRTGSGVSSTPDANDAVTNGGPYYSAGTRTPSGTTAAATQSDIDRCSRAWNDASSVQPETEFPNSRQTSQLSDVREVGKYAPDYPGPGAADWHDVIGRQSAGTLPQSDTGRTDGDCGRVRQPPPLNLDGINVNASFSPTSMTMSQTSPLSPRSDVSSLSGRRSAIPVPIWNNSARSRAVSDTTGPLSPISLQSPIPWSNGTSADRQHFNYSVRARSDVDANSVRHGDVYAGGRDVNGNSAPRHQDTLRRQDRTRASMFERGSRRHAHKDVNNNASRRSENGVRRRSITPPPQNGFVTSPPTSATFVGSSRAGYCCPTDNRTPSQCQHPVKSPTTRLAGQQKSPADNVASDRRLTSDRRTPVRQLPEVGVVNKFTPTTDVYGRPCPTANQSPDVADDGKQPTSDIRRCRVTITGVSDILSNLSSSDWSSRRFGLESLENMFLGGACLAAGDVKKVTDVFTRMFHDPQPKVFSVFIEVLAAFISIHSDDLCSWLPVVLPRLFVKLGADLRTSVLSKLQRSLVAIRERFPTDLQLDVLTRFMNEQVQAHTVKVKQAVLDYLHELVLDMEPEDLSNSPTLQTLQLKVIMWSADPQSADVRNSAQAVLAAMFNVNSPEFVLAMSTQPKGAQDLVQKILKAHMCLASGDSPEPTSTHQQPPMSNGRQRASPSVAASGVNVVVVVPNDALDRRYAGRSQSVMSSVAPSRDKPHHHHHHHDGGRTTPSSHLTRIVHDRSRSSPEKFPTQPPVQRQSSAQDYRQSFKNRSYRRDCMSIDSGVVTADDMQPTGEISPDTKILSPPFHNVTPSREPDLNDVFEQKSTLSEDFASMLPDELCLSGSQSERRRQWTDIVKTLSDSLASSDSRKSSMRLLIDSLPGESASLSRTTVKSLLHILLSATNVTDEVSVLANECASMLVDSALSIGDRCLLLSEIVSTGVTPVNVAALMMMLSKLDAETDISRNDSLSVVVASLIKAYEDDQTRVRKASVDCLVKLYEQVGDLLWSHIRGLGEAKMSYLRTRFRRAAALRLSVADAV